MKILLNGAGRIGRRIIHKLIFSKKSDLIQINDPYLSIENLAYLINFDSIYGKVKKKITVRGDYLLTGNNKILFTKDKSLLNHDLNNKVNLLIDSSGIKKNHDMIKRREVKNKFKTIITHTYDKADFHIIFGVNEKKYDKKKHNIISSSICDAVAIGPVINYTTSMVGISKFDGWSFKIFCISRKKHRKFRFGKSVY